MKLFSGLIAGIVGVGLLVGAGAASAVPVANLAKPGVTSNVEQVRDHRGYHSHKHWKKRHYHRRDHWRSDRRHYRDHRWQSHRHYKRDYYRGYHRHHSSRWNGPASSNR